MEVELASSSNVTGVLLRRDNLDIGQVCLQENVKENKTEPVCGPYL